MAEWFWLQTTRTSVLLRFVINYCQRFHNFLSFALQHKKHNVRKKNIKENISKKEKTYHLISHWNSQNIPHGITMKCLYTNNNNIQKFQDNTTTYKQLITILLNKKYCLTRFWQFQCNKSCVTATQIVHKLFALKLYCVMACCFYLMQPWDTCPTVVR